MPTPKTKRDILLKSSITATDTVATLSLGMDAQFATPAGTTTINLFQDASAATNEDTEYQMTFGPSTGAIGVVTIGFTGQDNPTAKRVKIVKTVTTSDFDPPETTTSVTPIASPDASWTRSWQQAALDAQSSQVVDQVGGIDIRVKAGTGYSVTQTVTSTATAELVLAYVWRDATGADVITGSFTFTASSVPGPGYSLGTATATDNAPVLTRNGRHR